MLLCRILPAALILAAALVSSCAGTRAGAPPTRTATAPERPISERLEGLEPTPNLLREGAGRVRTIALPIHQVASPEPTLVADLAPRPAPDDRPKIRLTDVPGPAGPARPGGRGIGYPSSSIPAFGPGATPGPDRTHGYSLLASLGAEDGPALAPPALASDFDSTTFDDNQTLTGANFVPPDTHAAAGPSHVVSVTNVVLQIHDKTGATSCKIALADFFDSQVPTTELFDPKILYDQFSGRWLVVALEQRSSPQTSRILLAVSDDSDPTDPGLDCGTWYQFDIDSMLSLPTGMPAAHWADFPGFGIDEEVVYVTANLFSFASGSFGGSRLWLIDKFGGSGGGFYGGGTATFSTALDPYACGNCIASTTQPAHVFGSAPTTPDVGTYLVSYSGLSEDNDGGSNEVVQVIRIDDVLPLGTTKTFTQEFILVGDLENLLGFPELPDAPQADTALTVEVNDRRALSAVWRNNRLYLSATINPKAGPDAGQATAHWWVLDTSTPSDGVDPPETALVDQGSIGGEDITLDDNPVFTFFPAIAVNAAEEIIVGFSASSSTIFPGSYFATRKSVDDAGTTSDSGPLRPGLDSYDRRFSGSENRWGDYSGAAVDPADQCFWVYNEHALCIEGSSPCSTVTANDNGRWGTAFGKACIDCAASPLTVSAPTATAGVRYRAALITVEGGADVVSGDLTLEGQTITFEEGFSVSGDLRVSTGFCPL